MRKRIKRGKILLKWHKGFTLYELIAVIIIIAVIALIGIPIVNQVIDSARQNALKDSAYGIIKSADIYYATKMSNGESSVEFDCSNNACTNGSEKLDFKGSVDEGKVKIYTDGRVSICIENDINSAYKTALADEVISQKGSCDYDGDDYSIDELVSLNRYNNLKSEYEDYKASVEESKEQIINSFNSYEHNISVTASFDEINELLKNILADPGVEYGILNFSSVSRHSGTVSLTSIDGYEDITNIYVIDAVSITSVEFDGGSQGGTLGGYVSSYTPGASVVYISGNGIRTSNRTFYMTGSLLWIKG